MAEPQNRDGTQMRRSPVQPDDAWRQRILRTHFATLAALFNPATFQHVDAFGIGLGWHCWEVGAGGPTVPAWLSGRVGREGFVLATDSDVFALEESAEPGYEIRRHDIAADPPPMTAEFDLVHARLVLMHVADREQALWTMREALRPGGWLLVEDADPALLPQACPDETGPGEELANKLRNACWTVVSQRLDLAFGRTLPRLLRGAGFTDVGADAYIPLLGPMQAQFQQTLIERWRQHLVETGMATDSEIERHLADVACERLDLAVFPLVSAWGRKLC